MTSILRSVRTLLLYTLDSLCFLILARRRKAAIVLRLDAIGDFFIWMQSGAVQIADLARAEGRRSILIANGAWADYARETGLWDAVVSVSPVRMMRNPIYRLKLLAGIRRLGAELLIQPRPARVFLQEDAIARTCGAPRRIGSAGTAINLKSRAHALGNTYYDVLVPVNDAREVHEVVRNADFVRTLTKKAVTPFAFARGGSRTRPRTVVVAIGAGQAGRVWPVQKLGELIQYVARAYPEYRIALLGSAAERQRSTQIEELPGIDVENRVGKTSLSELVRAIAEADLVICNDSSAYHIATAVGTKVVCFLGGGHFHWYAPYPDSMAMQAKSRVLYVPMDCYWCNWRCKFPRTDQGAFRCVASIPVDSAIDAVKSLLQGRPEGHANIPVDGRAGG